MSERLDAAEKVLISGGPQTLRRASWLTRIALDDVIVQLLTAKSFQSLELTKSNYKTRLQCLTGLYADNLDIPAKVWFAWEQLSTACHQHAYQLSPTLGEAQHNIELVRELEVIADAQST
jgi:hypothetical protein